jgi:hypothetical protein
MGKEQFRWESMLGALVSGKDAYFEKIACMSPDWREIISYLEVLKILDPEDKKTKEEIDKILVPVCQKLGQAEWMPDIISHLAMKLGSIEKVFDAL